MSMANQKNSKNIKSLDSELAESTELEKNIYRFGAYRYGLRGPAASGPEGAVPERVSLLTFPRKDS